MRPISSAARADTDLPGAAGDLSSAQTPTSAVVKSNAAMDAAKQLRDNMVVDMSGVGKAFQRFGAGAVKMFQKLAGDDPDAKLDKEVVIDWWSKFYASVGHDEAGPKYKGYLCRVCARREWARPDRVRRERQARLHRRHAGREEERRGRRARAPGAAPPPVAPRAGARVVGHGQQQGHYPQDLAEFARQEPRRGARPAVHRAGDGPDAARRQRPVGPVRDCAVWQAQADQRQEKLHCAQRQPCLWPCAAARLGADDPSVRLRHDQRQRPHRHDQDRPRDALAQQQARQRGPRAQLCAARRQPLARRAQAERDPGRLVQQARLSAADVRRGRRRRHGDDRGLQRQCAVRGR
eukprot:Unigene186_Nuclearia_a/m.644 Unigene186_Nuclearia_a/g.644  ORF Unigene186_Nuclearia_a/g.644 Unigene186_Nuclearia_a/m.644 type:complete len:350 (-) Unigene186_Nuclearia_a:1917-2966(-)